MRAEMCAADVIDMMTLRVKRDLDYYATEDSWERWKTYADV